MKQKTRLITLSDGGGMGDELIVFKTNAPIDFLKNLEKISNEAQKNCEEVPIWMDIVIDNGYQFEFIDSHCHVTAYGTSTDWLEKNFPKMGKENRPHFPKCI